MERDHRLQAEREERLTDAPVVIEGGSGELARLGLDAAPLDRESVRTEAELTAQRHVLGPAVPGVAGVAARFAAPRCRGVLPLPPVVVPVATLDLMGRGGGPPEEPR